MRLRSDYIGVTITRLTYKTGREMPNRIMTGLGQAFNHIDPEQVSNGQLYSLMYAMHAQQLDASREMTQLRDELRIHKEDMKEVSEAWRTSLAILKVLRTMAAIGVPIAAVYGIVKTGIIRTISGA